MESPELKTLAEIAPAEPNILPIQLATDSCPSCTSLGAQSESMEPTYVYAIGTLEIRFPRISVEKEFAQAMGRSDTKGLTDRQALHAVLSHAANRYLVRQLCWVLAVEGLETYILQPRDSLDFSLLVDAVRPVPSPMDLDVVIGVKGPIAQPGMCNGLMVPIVIVDQIYSFDRDSLIKSIPRPEKLAVAEFEPAAEELLQRIMQIADNSGAANEHRALNYCALRYPAIYAVTAERFARNSSLTAVNVQPSNLSTTRQIMEVIFSFTDRATDVSEKYFCRIDVTEEFPFLVTKLSPYFDR